MPDSAWELRQTPHRHYRYLRDDDKWAWANRDKTRIASVTTVLDGDMDRLLGWAVGKSLVAAEAVWRDALPFNPDDDFGELCQATGLMPDTYRDLKGDIGTAGHAYLEWCLAGRGEDPQGSLPYGYRLAIDAFLEETGFRAALDDRGPRVERAVGDEARAVAGTYDAQGERARACALHPGVHRIDLKSSNSLQPKQFMQVCTYEELAVLCGEEPSDWCTLVHIDALGSWTPHSVAVGSDGYLAALSGFGGALALYRASAACAKLLK